MLAMILPLVIAFATISRLKPLTKIFLGYACLILVVGIGLTLSRGGWIATFSALLVFLAAVLRLRRHRTTALIAVLSLACIGGLFISKSVVGRARLQRAFNYESKANVRFAIWETAWDMWLDHPATGVGPGHFDRRYREYRSHELQARPERAHNDYLNTLADLGVVGLGLGLAVIGALMASSRRNWARIFGELGEDSSQRSDRLALNLGLSCALVAMLLHALFDFPAHIPGLALLFAFLMGILAAQTCRQGSSRHRNPLDIKVKCAVSAVAVCMMVGLTWAGLVRSREHRHLERTKDPEIEFGDYIGNLEAARRIAPSNPDTPYLLAEAYRRVSFRSPVDWREKAESAIKWYEIAVKLDPFDSLRRLRLGQCHDWLERPDEAWIHYERALELDPEDFLTASVIGWHYLQRDELISAKRWYEQSVFRNPGPENTDSWERLKDIEMALGSGLKTGN